MTIIQIHQEVYGNVIEMIQMIIKSFKNTFKFKIKKTWKTHANDNEKNVKIVVPLKYLSNFWRTLETPLINCEISLDLTWCENCVISFATEKNKICNHRYKTLCSCCNFINKS